MWFIFQLAIAALFVFGDYQSHVRFGSPVSPGPDALMGFAAAWMATALLSRGWDKLILLLRRQESGKRGGSRHLRASDLVRNGLIAEEGLHGPGHQRPPGEFRACHARRANHKRRWI